MAVAPLFQSMERVNLSFFGFKNILVAISSDVDYNDFFALQLVAKVANATTDTELMGIRMAATTGER